MDTNAIHIKGSGNIVIQGATNSPVTIHTDNADDIFQKLKLLNNQQLSALKQVGTEQTNILSELFKDLFEKFISQKNDLIENISNVQSIKYGDEIHYHFHNESQNIKTLSWQESTEIEKEPLKSINQTLVEISNSMLFFPYAAFIYHDKLKEIVDQINILPGFEKKHSSLAAFAYRLYSASIILKPQDSKTSPLKALDFGYPWLMRALAVNFKFEDDNELILVGNYIRKILIEMPPSVKMEELLKNEFRIAMVESDESEINTQVKNAVEIIKNFIDKKAMNTLEKKELAAIQLGFTLGGKIILITLPQNHKNRLSPMFHFTDEKLLKALNVLEITESESNKIIGNLQKAFKNPNHVMAASLVIDEINKIRNFLVTLSSGNKYAAIFRIGIAEGYRLECALIVSGLNPNATQMAQFESLIKKWSQNLTSDLIVAHLPEELTQAIHKTNIKLATIKDLENQIAACKILLELINQ